MSVVKKHISTRAGTITNWKGHYSGLNEGIGDVWGIDSHEVDSLWEVMEKYGVGSGQIVDEVLQNEGRELIEKKIARLIPRSGRKWAKKAQPAASAMPASFAHFAGEGYVEIVGRGNYGYLYFPDDGSNTRKHAGNQQFMRRGAEAASGRVIEMCVGRLLENFGG